MFEVHTFKNRVLVTDMEFGIVKTDGGFLIPDDDGKSIGIKSRWAKVYKVGPEVTDIREGDFICVDHGRWTRAFEVDTKDLGKIKIHMVDYPKAVLAVTKEKPQILNQLQKTI